jgi:hypothetical protein
MLRGKVPKTSQGKSILNHIDELNADTPEQRLHNLRKLVYSGISREKSAGEVNNHVHTFYSFSPYSPSAAACSAYKAGLDAVGSIDHDSISAAREMYEACRILGIASTAGCELRVNFSGTALEGRTLNNPDLPNIGYIVFHGVPAGSISTVESFLRPIQEARNRRNRDMTEKLNTIISDYGIEEIDFTGEIYRKSMASAGGSITERHILFALCRKLTAEYGKGEKLTAFLTGKLGLRLPGTIRDRLSDPENPHYLYDLLGILKSTFTAEFFISPDTEECIGVSEAVDFANSVGAIPAYAYLGDVTESPTGDKKAQKFEDDYLEELFRELKNLCFRAVTYMPPRNTREQLRRVQELCARYSLMEISGVDINSSRQSFNCPEILDPQFEHLFENTWALITHERLSETNLSLGLFNPKSPFRSRELTERIGLYAKMGKPLSGMEEN